eukprot:Rhum_TRINITY_DN15255_c1_g1::Rhum_TRINITY_DN15255_c1_g1_i1::g.146381::m.146381/K05349/bglX; beta-glucosidase
MKSVACAALLLACGTASATPAWMDVKLTPAQRAAKLVANMTVDELVHLMHGSGSGYVGNVEAIPRVGIPAIKMNDGPQGFRDNARPGTSTAWPSGLTMAAAFDVEVASLWGTAMGKEFYQKGANVQLGPGLCVARVPRNGRNFEYLSGEDPFLGYTLVKPAIQGIQSQGVIANAKHYVNNNQETNRQTISEDVDLRTRAEIYYPPFLGAVEAGVGSVMCSYNKINNRWSCENPETLGQLKGMMGYKGWVMSDWGATHSTSINDGLDQEMPGATYMGDSLLSAYKAGTVTLAKLQDSAQRILWPMFQMGIMDTPNPNKITNNVTSAAHNLLARKIATQATVLLQNGILPLAKEGTAEKPVVYAIVGSQAADPIVHGGGSGQVVPYYTSAPLDAINALLKTSPTKDGRNCSAEGKVCTVYYDGSDLTGVDAATAALVFVGTSSHEGADRTSLSLGDGQDELVFAVAAANPNTVVSAATPGALLTPWRQHVKSILIPFMPGQEYGNAVADLIFGDAAPSARLPLSFPNKENEVEFTPQQWPGVNLQANYTEHQHVGYRWYTAHGVRPAFAFGHGLTYGSVSFSNLRVAGRTVTATLANGGSASVTSTPQLYVEFPASADSPPLQLKGFKKVTVAGGRAADVSFTLEDKDLSVFDAATKTWTLVKGTVGVRVGDSSIDLPLSGKIVV